MQEKLDPWAPYDPTPADPWDLRKVGHLHRRSGFGATWAEQQRDLKDGPAASVERLLKPPPLTAEEKQVLDSLRQGVLDSSDSERLNVDGDGKPLVRLSISPDLVVTPGCSRWDYERMARGELKADEANPDRHNYWRDKVKTDADGRVTIPALIPGASYRLASMKGPKVVSRDFSVEAGQTLELGDIVMKRQE